MNWMHFSTLRKLTLISILVLLVGCHSIGPRQISLDRGRYNDIVRETDEAQFLKNIVRLRYVEPTYFLKVTGVTSSYTLNSSITADPNGSWMGGIDSGLRTSLKTWAMGVTPTLTYSDSPTISYAPLDDAEFIGALLRPISFRDVILLFHGGIHDSRLMFRLIFDQIGRFDNISFSTSSGYLKVSHSYDAQFNQYLLFLEIMHQLIMKKELSITPINYEKQLGLLLHFYNENSQGGAKLKKLLNLKSKSSDIALFNEGFAANAANRNGEVSISPRVERNIAFVNFRSVYGILTFLSNAVQVPPADLKKCRSYITTYEDGTPFDWRKVMRGIMTIYSSRELPRDAFVRTQYNGYWFYISNSDIASKRTFTLATRLLILTAGRDKTPTQTAPVLTLPVGAR
ncbi:MULTISPECIES: hypothetical protein [Legionella]|uniref:Uncharacterized protein n=2 Tax=Legionella drozanskii TaxID=96228 RepID=A0A0W0SXZ8_9GAMM|nr:MULTISPECIES: hypothetical protein [Legionella]KTC88140.1 hypothetical protein Ldro_1759 [Legionella drozanskii LLAP-1]